MRDYSFFSYAKINLHLQVLRKRPNGYHEIETIFYRIPLKDQLRISARSGKGLTILCSHPEVPRNSSNTIAKAYRLLCRYLREEPGIDVEVQKKVPISGGLGGGSANAAAFLLSINQFLKLRLPFKTLLHIGKEVGADVPFFLMNEPAALARGVGQDLTPLKAGLRGILLLVLPPFGVSTAWAYSHLSFPLTPPSTDINMLAPFVERGEIRELAARAFNHLEGPVFSRYPPLESVKMGLQEKGAAMALLSGSGSTLFGIFYDVEKAQEGASWISKMGWKTIRISLEGNGV